MLPITVLGCDKDSSELATADIRLEMLTSVAEGEDVGTVYVDLKEKGWESVDVLLSGGDTLSGVTDTGRTVGFDEIEGVLSKRGNGYFGAFPSDATRLTISFTRDSATSAPQNIAEFPPPANLSVPTTVSRSDATMFFSWSNAEPGAVMWGAAQACSGDIDKYTELADADTGDWSIDVVDLVAVADVDDCARVSFVRQLDGTPDAALRADSEVLAQRYQHFDVTLTD